MEGFIKDIDFVVKAYDESKNITDEEITVAACICTRCGTTIHRLIYLSGLKKLFLRFDPASKESALEFLQDYGNFACVMFSNNLNCEETSQAILRAINLQISNEEDALIKENEEQIYHISMRFVEDVILPKAIDTDSLKRIKDLMNKLFGLLTKMYCNTGEE